MSKSLKQRMADGELVRIFSMGRVINTVVIDLFQLAGGYHGFWLDQEHCGLTYEQINLSSVCGRANGFDCFVRMAPTDYSLVTQNLEAGAGGVLAARIESAAQAEEFVTWAKFAPRGMRGLNSSGRDADYTHKPAVQYAQDANRDHLVGIQIETMGALEEADQIAAIDGVDLLFLGPADLSQAMGLLGQMEHPQVQEAIRHVARCCHRHGKSWGTVPVSPEMARRVVDEGCRMIVTGSDVVCLRRGIEAVKATFADQF
jgi:2-dehydro-3-deoxyglucarate aldolase/4-hydroxy-2-oxoheptanedioate aldolase